MPYLTGTAIPSKGHPCASFERFTIHGYASRSTSEALFDYLQGWQDFK